MAKDRKTTSRFASQALTTRHKVRSRASLVAAGGSGQEIELWQLPDDPWESSDDEVEQLFRLQSGAGWISQMGFSPDGERIAVPGLTGLVEIRDMDTGELLLGLQHPAGVVKTEFTPDGRFLVTSGRDGIFRIWTLDLNELTALAQSRVTRSLTESECQQYLHRDGCRLQLLDNSARPTRLSHDSKDAS